MAATSQSVVVRYGGDMRFGWLILAVGFTAAGVVGAVHGVASTPFAVGLVLPGMAIAMFDRSMWRWRPTVDADGWHGATEASARAEIISWAEVARVVTFRGERRRSFVADRSGARLFLVLPSNARGRHRAKLESEDVVLREAHWLAHRLGEKPVTVVVDMGDGVPASGDRPAAQTTFWTGCPTCERSGADTSC